MSHPFCRSCRKQHATREAIRPESNVLFVFQLPVDEVVLVMKFQRALPKMELEGVQLRCPWPSPGPLITYRLQLNFVTLISMMLQAEI